MKPLDKVARNRSQAGFSMVEMLMAALILSIGVLGVSLMQVMSLKAARGGQSLVTAAQVGEKVMDQVEMEGRLTWLNATNSNYTTPPALPPLTYLGATTTYPVQQTLTIKGQTPVSTSSDPRDTQSFFTVNTTVGTTVKVAGGIGGYSPVTVVVQFQDSTTKAGAPIVRSITLNRTVIHG